MKSRAKPTLQCRSLHLTRNDGVEISDDCAEIQRHRHNEHAIEHRSKKVRFDARQCWDRIGNQTGSQDSAGPSDIASIVKYCEAKPCRGQSQTDPKPVV